MAETTQTPPLAPLQAFSENKTTQLDHIVILVSPEDFVHVPSWLSDNFTIIEGGTHSKGTSRNKLIIFKDGTYIELFSWVDPQPAGIQAHADFPGWAKKPVGCIIDWALTGDDAHGKYHDMVRRLKALEPQGEHLGVMYEDLKEGGRKRKDGEELRWVTTRPRSADSKPNVPQVNVPFFCHDVSPRMRRVPYTEGSDDRWPDLVTHPCGAVGIEEIVIEVPAPHFQAYTRLYESIIGSESILHSEQSAVMLVGTPELVVEEKNTDTDGKPFRSDDIKPSDAGPLRCLVRVVPSHNAASDTASQESAAIKKLTLSTVEKNTHNELDTREFATSIELRYREPEGPD